MRIHAFQGIRYTDGHQAGSLAGPPYDQIDPDLQRQLHRSAKHFAHLIRPDAPQGDPHQHAADLHHQWLSSGTLMQEQDPALYPYVIDLAEGGQRLGICALVDLESPDAGVIRPHEATVAKTVDERLALLRKTRVDFEPILMLAEDGGGLDHLLQEHLSSCEPLTEHMDASGNRHRLYRTAHPAQIEAYRQLLASSVGLIADGHHRYTVASLYAKEIGAARGTAGAAKLAVITSISGPGLRIDPIHRRLSEPLDLASARSLAAAHETLTPGSGEEIAAAVAGASQPTLGVSYAGRSELWRFRRDAAPDSLPEHLRHLPVGWLHDVLLPALGLPASTATDGTVGYRSDPERLFAELAGGSATVGFWLPPMTGDDFAHAMTGRSLLPPKSTRFLPKVASGLVWATHDSRLG